MQNVASIQIVADIFRARRDDSTPALYFEERCWSGAELYAACATRAGFLQGNRRDGSFHVGILMDNVPEHLFWIGACALSGATYVALNSTRKGADLARDIAHTECQFVISEEAYRNDLPAPVVDPAKCCLFVADDPGDSARLLPFNDHVPVANPSRPDERFCLMFTSGTSGAPKAVIYSNQRVIRNSVMLVQGRSLTPQDITYVPMPLFHSTGLIMGLLPLLIAGGSAVLRRRFSASGFLADVRRYGVTTFCYVGKPLAYILATEEKDDDHHNSLRLAYGSEAPDTDIAEFSRRFGCEVMDNYGSSEGCITILRTPGTPPGSIGTGVSDSIVVMNAETGRECPRAVFDEHHVLCNPNEAIGELVNLDGAALFEGYWNNPEADLQRFRGKAYWSGDLAYRDAAGFFYFAGRNSEWLRVDGENLACVQIEQVLARHPLVSVAAVYGVPDPLAGDCVMAALELRPGARLDLEEFRRFLAAQPDFGRKWMPAFVRISAGIPLTHSNKVLKKSLVAEAWNCTEPVWWRAGREHEYRLLQPADAAALNQTLATRGHNRPLQGT